MKRFLIIVFISFFSETPAQTDSIQLSESNNRYFRFIYDNDFFSATDRYYSQGVMTELIAPFLRHSPFSYSLIRLNKRAVNHYGLSFQQDCFTPKSIRMDTLNRLERPFTGTFVMRHTLYSIDPYKKQRLTTKLELGIIGPNAKCEETQKGIHRALVNIQPQGWEWQLSQDIVINYNATFEKGIISKKYFEMIVYGEGRAGTLYDDIAGGLYFRFGLMNSYFKNFGISKISKENKFQFYLGARGQAKVVGYNATLQGGPFSTSIYEMNASTVERKVYTAYFSAILSYKRISLEYMRAYLTKEFYRGIDHGWGRAGMTVCF